MSIHIYHNYTIYILAIPKYLTSNTLYSPKGKKYIFQKQTHVFPTSIQLSANNNTFLSLDLQINNSLKSTCNNATAAATSLDYNTARFKYTNCYSNTNKSSLSYFSLSSYKSSQNCHSLSCLQTASQTNYNMPGNHNNYNLTSIQ